MTQLYSVYLTKTEYNDIGKLRVKGGKYILYLLYHTHINQWEAGVPKLLSEKVNFRAKRIITTDIIF